jgi:two-component system KDP operon response regulator KdpE
LTAGPLVLLVEDEPEMRRFIRASLTAHGYRLVEAVTGKEGTTLAASHNPELVLLDLGLPDEDGLAVTARLRAWSKVPIVVLSARGKEEDKVKALDAGADDYLTKPFGVNELLARMRVALRHARKEASEPTLKFGDVELDLNARVVRRAGTELHLTPIEYRLFAYLAQNAGKVLTHRQILHEVWGPGSAHQTHYVRVHLAELRKKIETEPSRPKLVVTEPGVGYRLKAE